MTEHRPSLAELVENGVSDPASVFPRILLELTARNSRYNPVTEAELAALATASQREQAEPWRQGLIILWALAELKAAPAWHAVGDTWLPTGSLIRALETCRAAAAGLHAEDAVRGIAALVHRDITSALGDFEQFATWPSLSLLGGSALNGARNCRAVHAAADVATAALPFDLSGIVWFGEPPPRSSDPSGPAPHSIVFAGDPIYTRAFGPNLVRTLNRHAARPQHVHFHVVTNHAEDPRIYLAPSEACPNVLMTASVESVPVDDTTYFACARFVRAGEIVMRFGRRCVFLDLDSEFVDDPGSHVEGMPETAVGVFTGHPAGSGFFPWTQIMAGALVLPAMSTGLSYAQLLRASIGYLWAGNQHSRWWIDQAALALATHLTQAYSSKCSIVGLSSKNLRCCDTGAHIKAKCLPSLPEIRARMDNGTTLLQALRQVQADWRRAEQDLATTAGRVQAAG